MVEKEDRQMAENGKAQKAAPERRKGYFYLWLAAWWPTTRGRKRLTRKGVERRLEAFKESETCAAKEHSFPQGNARERTICDS